MTDLEEDTLTPPQASDDDVAGSEPASETAKPPPAAAVDDSAREPASPEAEIEATTAPDGTASSTYVQGDSIRVAGDLQLTSIRIESNEAVRNLRDLFGTPSNHETFEVEVEDLIAPPETKAHFEALGEQFVLVLASTRLTGLSTAAELRCKAFAEAHGLPARKSQATSAVELTKELKGLDRPTVLVLDASQNPDLERELHSYAEQIRDTLKKQECHLVLAVEIEFRRMLKRNFPDSVFDLERIEPDRIFTRHFERSDADFEEILQSEYFKDTLGTAWPPLARLMTTILNNAPSGLSVAGFEEHLKDRIEDSSATIRDLLEKQLDPQGKAVLVTAAVLERLSPRSIALAADDFLWISRDDDTAPVEVLGDYGILQKLELIREVFYIEGTNFKSPDLGDEVLLHVWEQYPAWHLPMRRWLARLLIEPDYLEWTNLTRLPRRLVRLASAAEDGSMLAAQADVMTRSRSSVIRSLASAVLLGGALDDTIGGSVRRRLYDWSGSPRYDRQLAALEACADNDYLVRFPGNALFRLRLLARSGYSDIREAAFEAIIESSAHMHLGDLVFHFRHWLYGSELSETQLIPGLLDRICVKPEVLERLREHPRLLLDDPVGHVKSFWQLLFELADPTSVRLATRAWLSAATEIVPADGERMVDLVAEASATDYGSIGQLAQAAKSLMLDGSGLPARTRQLSRRMLDKVFEIEVPLP